jgi:hypothetical protein
MAGMTDIGQAFYPKPTSDSRDRPQVAFHFAALVIAPKPGANARHRSSPGLVSSILMWMNLYFVVRYHPPDEAITFSNWIPALVIGGAFTAFLLLYYPFAKGRQMRRS